MQKIIDIVNFNSDASCLSTTGWLNALSNRRQSQLCRWLDAYIGMGKKVVLGFTGATIADMRSYNPESIALINNHPEVFQIILRPFSHDIGLMRSSSGFEVNFKLGTKAIRREFENIISFFLPPEFMLTGEQVHLLEKNGVAGTFINPDRFTKDLQKRLPHTPYRVKGVMGAELTCVPCFGELTQAFLTSLHGYDATAWNTLLGSSKQPEIYAWRDGESAFFLPDGAERELHWLSDEANFIERTFLDSRLLADHAGSVALEEQLLTAYPVHSFSAWMKEFRMLGYLQRILEIEKRITDFTLEQTALWLQVINSDVLSSVEKEPVQIQLKGVSPESAARPYTVNRCERGFEGEDYLSILERLITGNKSDYRDTSDAPHIARLRSRTRYLDGLGLTD